MLVLVADGHNFIEVDNHLAWKESKAKPVFKEVNRCSWTEFVVLNTKSVQVGFSGKIYVGIVEHVVQYGRPVVVKNEIFVLVKSASIEFACAWSVHTVSRVLLVRVVNRRLPVLLKPVADELPHIVSCLHPLSNLGEAGVQLPDKVKHNFHPLEVSLVLGNNTPEQFDEPAVYLACDELTLTRTADQMFQKDKVRPNLVVLIRIG